ncbi:MAG: hypothetical protein PHC74_05415, partial [Sulfurimonas sp.]|nr:hypothetical protein [Sulfurimonas sp.]
MILVKKIIPSVLAASLLITFSACGGGGDSTTPTATPLSSLTTSGTAADGYISGGTACLDLNLNNTCDSASEPIATTSTTGTFTLNVTALHQTHANYATAPVIVYDGTDIDTKKPFMGVMKAPYIASSTSQIVSPISTLVQAVIKSGKTEAEAKTAVATALNISADDVLKDPVATPAITKAALTVQKTLEVLAQANITAGTSTSTTAAFDTICTQLAAATVSVSEGSGTKSFTSVVAEAKTEGTLLGGAASSADVATVIESAITSSTLSGADLALVAESQIEALKTLVIANSATVTETEAQTTLDDAESNIRVIKVIQILDGINATTTQKTTVLALGDIISLVETTNTTTITNALVAAAIAESGDETIANLAIALGETPKVDLSGEITSDRTLTADTVWVLNGLVAVKNGATLTIEPGTKILGAAGTGAATSYLVIDKGSKINATGTAAKPIIFESETKYDGGTDAWGQWGGLVLIGNAGNAQVGAYEANSNFVAGTSNMADNSGVLSYVELYNSGITMETDKEINGISFVGVGSGTTVNNITIKKSDDDCIELWGGTVNLSNINLSECSDDHFDIDDGYAGTVTDLTITQTTGNAGIEMSGTTAATFNNLGLTVNSSVKEGGIYFKGTGIGGHFNNSLVTYNVSNSYGAIHSNDVVDLANISFANVTLAGTNTTDKFTGTSAANIKAIFDAQ